MPDETEGSARCCPVDFALWNLQEIPAGPPVQFKADWSLRSIVVHATTRETYYDCSAAPLIASEVLMNEATAEDFEAMVDFLLRRVTLRKAGIRG